MNDLTNNRWPTVLTLLLVTANIITLSILWINQKGNGPGNRRLPAPPQGQVFEFIDHELKLDSVQRETYRKLREDHQAGLRPIQDSLRKLKDVFFALLQKTDVTDVEIEAAAKGISGLEQQTELHTFRHFQKLRVLCNTAQQKKFDEIIKQVLRMMAPPRNRQGPPPPGVKERGEQGPGDFPPPPGPENEPRK